MVLNAGSDNFENEGDLMECLLKDYNPLYRPVKQFSTPLDVAVGVQIRRVESLVGIITY